MSKPRIHRQLRIEELEPRIAPVGTWDYWPQYVWGSPTQGSATGDGISTVNYDDSNPAIITGANGCPIIAWEKDPVSSDVEIYVLRWDGSSWAAMGSSGSGGGVSNNSGDSYAPAIAADTDGNPIVAWGEDVNLDGVSNDIYVKRWNGASWVEMGSGSASGGGISNTSDQSEVPAMATDLNGHPIVAWQEYTGGDREIFVRRWDGSSWVEMGAGSASGGGISNNAGQSFAPAIAVGTDGNPIIAWYDNSGGDTEIYVRRWDGSSWVEMGTGSASGGGISNNLGASENPAIAIGADGKPVVAWQDDSDDSGWPEIFVRRWDGSSWAEMGAGSASGGGISNGTLEAKNPAVIVGGDGNPVVAWDYGEYRIYVRRWDGCSWGIIGPGSASGGGVDNNSSSYSEFPTMVKGTDGDPILAWRDGGGLDEYHIYVRHYISNPTVTITVADPSGYENGQDSAAFTISREYETSQQVVISYTLAGTALYGTEGDYTTAPAHTGAITLGAGVTSGQITVGVIDDILSEGPETVILTLSTSGDYFLGATTSGTATIYDDETPSVSIIATDASAAEAGLDPGVFAVTRTGTIGDLMVSYTIGGTATNETDYALLSGAVTIGNGQSSATITISPVDDTLGEVSETVILTLATGGSYVVGSPSQGTVTIADNEPRVNVQATDASAAETGPDNGIFTVTRTGDTSGDLVVYYTVGGTATDGADYDSLSGALTIGAGSTAGAIVLAPVDDAEKEGLETAILTLSTNGAYVIGTAGNATVTISDNDYTVTVTATDPAAAETGSNPGVFTVTRDGTVGTLVVSYSMSGSAANGTDYSSLPGTLTFGAGTSSKTVTVTPINDTEYELDETVILTLTANGSYVVGSPGSDTVTIASDETAYTVNLSIFDGTATEEGSNSAAFRVYRNGTVGDLAVYYTMTTSGTAINGVDYETLTGVVTIGAGSTAGYVYILPIDDPIREGDEAAYLQISTSGSYIRGATYSKSVTIGDYDKPWVEVGAGSASGGGISNTPGSSSNASVAFGSDGFPVVAWDDDSSGNHEIYLRRWDGSSWVEMGTGSATGGGISSNAGDSLGPSLVTAPDGSLAVAWTDNSSGNYEVYVRRWDGSSWVEMGSGSATGGGISSNAGTSGYWGAPALSLAAGGGNLVAAWQDNSGSYAGVYVRQWNGSSWAEVGAGSASGTGISADYGYTPSVAVGTDGRPIVAWMTSFGIYVQCWDGSSWVEIGTGSASGGGISNTSLSTWNPAIVIGTDGRPVVAWEQYDSQGYPDEIYVKRWDGSSWVGFGGNPRAVWETEYNMSPTLAFGADGNPILAWTNYYSNNYNISVRHWNGAAWVELGAGSASGGGISVTGGASYPTIATTANGIPAVAWGRNGDIYIKKLSGVSVEISATDPVAEEADGSTGTFTVTRGGSTAGDMVVYYSVSGLSTATSGDDYAPLPGTMTLGTGYTSGAITVTPADDSLSESDETVSVILLGTDYYYTWGDRSSTVTIWDGDPSVTIVGTDTAGAELGTEPAVFRVDRAGGIHYDLPVYYTDTTGTAISGSDYNALPGVITIGAGSTSGTITVTPVNDLVPEDVETVILALSTSGSYVVGTAGSVTATIVDNDSTVTVVTSDAVGAETVSSGNKSVTFTITRTGSTSGNLTVYYTMGGAASSGSDYPAPSGYVTITNGAATGSVTITPTDDPFAEGHERVSLALTTSGTYIVGSPATATAAIIDDPWVEMSPGSASGGGISNDSMESWSPRMALGTDGYPIVAWVDGEGVLPEDYEIYVRRWNGSSWVEMGTGSASGGGISRSPGHSMDPAMALGTNGKPVIAWSDRTSGDDEIYVRRWDDSSWVQVGAGSASGGGISNNADTSESPTIAIGSDGNPIVAWEDDSGGDTEIYVLRWNGSSWVEMGAGSASGGGVSNNSGSSYAPSLTLDADGKPVLAWYDSSGGNREIYVRRWNGSSWQEMGTGSASGGGISNNSGWSEHPFILKGTDGNPIVLWDDDTRGNDEIYVRRWDGASWVEMGAGSASGGGISNDTASSYAPVMISKAGANPIAAWKGASTLFIKYWDGSSWLDMAGGGQWGGSFYSGSSRTTAPQLAYGSDGNPIVAWDGKDSVELDEEIVVRRFAPLVVTVTATDSSAAEEGTDPAVFTFTRQGTTGYIVVYYNVGGTAANGTDYGLLAGTVGIGAGSMSSTLTVTPVDDSQYEGAETVIITLADDYGTAGEATATLLDNDTEVAIEATDPVATEGGDTGVFTVTRTGDTTDAIVVSYTRSGSATEGVDYQALSGAITIGAGATSGTITVTPLDNAVPEGSETVIVTLSTSGSYTIGTVGSATVTISDEGDFWVELGMGSASGGGISGNTSGSANPAVAVGADGNPVVVWSEDTSGDGYGGEIYVKRWDGAAWAEMGAGSATGGGISNNAGGSFNPTIVRGSDGNPIVAWHDTSGGDAEIYVLRWNGAAWVEMGAGSASGGGISNNSGASSSAAIAVGADGKPVVTWRDSSGGNSEIYVRRWDGSSWVELGGSATGGGISNNSGFSTLPTIAIGTGGRPIVAWQDNSGGDTEIYVRCWDGSSWVEAGGGSGSGGGISNNTGGSEDPTLVVGMDGLPIVAWEDYTASLPNIYVKRWDGSSWVEMGAGSASGVGISGGSGNSVNPAIVSGLGGNPIVAWENYLAATGAWEIFVRRWNGTSWVEMGGASASGGGISASPGYSQWPAVAVRQSGNVVVAWSDRSDGDDEIYVRQYTRPTVTITATDPNASEDGPDAGVFTVTRTGDTTDAIVVSYTRSGSATEGVDYQALSGAITIGAGATSGTITVTPVDDSDVEGNETVIVTLATSGSYTLGTSDSATVTISDTLVTIQSWDHDATEGSGFDTGSFAFMRSGDTTNELVVYYNISGTATNGTDYETLSGAVTFGVGGTMAPVYVAALSDGLAEGDETVIVTLATSGSYTVGSPNSQTVTIHDPPTVWVVTTDANACELGSDNGVFRICRNGTSGMLMVSYTMSGTATNGTDYSQVYGMLMIPYGMTYGDIYITPTQDSEVEGPETAILTLSTSGSYVVGSPDSGTVTITDDTLPRVTIEATDASASEAGPDAGVFTVSRTDTVGDLVVNYTVGGTATDGADYASLSGALTIGSGNSSATITISPVDDTDVEGAETVIVTLSTSGSYVVGTSGEATVTIADNDLYTVTVTATDPAASETGSAPGVFRVSRGGTVGDLVVDYTMGGTATDGTDYIALSGAVTIGAGTTSGTIMVYPFDDAAIEGPETAIITLSTSGSYIVGTAGEATVTIADNDLYTVTVTATDPSASETGPDPGMLTVSRDGTIGDLAIAYTVIGQATPGTDYQTLSGALTIGAGSTSATITVTPIDDSLFEGSETVIVYLSTSASYQVGSPGFAGVTIADNDVQTVSIAATDPNASEPGTDLGVFTISRLGTLGDVVVSYTVSGTATPGADYIALSGTVSIMSGESSKNITVWPNDDFLAEGPETVIVTLSTSGDYTISGAAAATVTIEDNEMYSVNVAATDKNAWETGPDSGMFTVTRGGTTGDLVVNYTVGGTATAGTDYMALTGAVTIGAGASSASITVTPIDDTDAEGPETVSVTLSTSGSYVIGTAGSATVVIADDDTAAGGPGEWLALGPWSGVGGGISNNPTGSYAPAVLFGTNGNPIVAWYDNASGDYEIYVEQWNGSSWVEMGAGSASGGGISNNSGDSREPVIALGSGGGPIVAWCDYSGGSDGDIYVRQWDGASWAEIGTGSATGRGISNDTGYSGSPAIAAGTDGSAVIAWVGSVQGYDTEIYVRRWNGSSWAEMGAGSASWGGISNNAWGSLAPSVALGTNGNPVVAWMDETPGAYDIFLLQWNGSSWVELDDSASFDGISMNTTASQYPSVAIGTDGRPIVAWQNGYGAQSEIYVRRWSGTAWVEMGSSGTGQGISKSAGVSEQPSIGVSADGSAFVAWQDRTDGDFEVYVRRWDGASWIEMPTGSATGGGISNNSADSRMPALAIGPNRLFAIAWADNSGGDSEIYVRQYEAPLPTVTITATDPDAGEAGLDEGVFSVTRNNAVVDLVVQYTLSGSATPGTDYTGLSGTLTIAAGSTSGTITVSPIDDTAPEDAETVVVTLSTSGLYLVGSPGEATVTIWDDDPIPTLTVQATVPNANEIGPVPGYFTVLRTGTGGDLVVNYTVSGSATSGADYIALSGAVTIGNGSSSTTFPVTPIDDAESELPETVILTLSTSGSYTIGTAGSATVTIAGDGGSTWENYGAYAWIGGTYGDSPALALGTDGKPIVAWQDYAPSPYHGDAVFLKRWNGLSWEGMGGSASEGASATACGEIAATRRLPLGRTGIRSWCGF